MTYALSASDRGTTLTVDVSLAPLTDDEMLEDFKEGWTSGLDRLERLIEADAFA